MLSWMNSDNVLTRRLTETDVVNLKDNNMASASSTSARSLFVESKIRLADRVQVNVNNIASLARQIQRGSKSSEILMHSYRNFTQQEHGLESVETNLKKIELITTHLNFQIDAIERSLPLFEEVTEQVRAMQR